MGGTLGEGSSHADFFAAGDGGGGGRWGGRRGGERGTEVVRILPGEPAWRKPSGRDRPLRTLLGESAWEAHGCNGSHGPWLQWVPWAMVTMGPKTSTPQAVPWFGSRQAVQRCFLLLLIFSYA